MEKFSFLGADGLTTIACYYYPSQIPTKGLIYFAHGVSEYALRHSEFFKTLTKAGYSVLANDHMGHGNSIATHSGYFNSRGGARGWDCACRDAYRCIYEGQNQFQIPKSLPVYGIGFSLGSFIVRTLAIRSPLLFRGMVLIGTGYQNLINTTLGKHVAESEAEIHGHSSFTDKVTELTFGEYNKTFEGKTKADWLCANEVARQRYLADEKCTEGFTAGLFADLLFGMEYTCDRGNMKQMEKDMPIYMVSGADDPVGNFGDGIKKLYKKLHRLGFNVGYSLFANMRHDVLHERNAHYVLVDIIRFLDRI